MEPTSDQQLEQEMQLARKEFQKALPAMNLRELASKMKPPQAWYDEDFSDLMKDVPLAPSF